MNSKKEVRKLAKKTNHTHRHKTSKFYQISVIIGILGILVGILSIVFVNQQVSASTKLEWQKEVSRKQCAVTGDPIINVEQSIINDADSGQAGNYWAFDTIERHIKVWKKSDAVFCATVTYEGRFAAIAGQRSPGNTGILTGSEKGEFEGGYVAAITGSLLTNPSLPTHGSIGKTDYRCDVNGNCPGAFDWSTKYFNTSATGFTRNLTWWGWTYKNGKHVWVNSIDGNSGDII